MVSGNGSTDREAGPTAMRQYPTSNVRLAVPSARAALAAADLDLPEAVLAEVLPEWATNPILVSMGAERRFDYANDTDVFEDRLTRCYELAARAFHWHPNAAWAHHNVPAPAALIHGSWHWHDAPKRIDHAWVLLEDSRIWEPITQMICDPEKFSASTRSEVGYLYDDVAARRNLMRFAHWGPWHDEVSGNGGG